MTKGKQARREMKRRVSDFSRAEIHEICWKYGSSGFEISARSLADKYDASEETIRKLFRKGIVEGIVSMDIARAIQKTSMHNARRSAANSAEVVVRNEFRNDFLELAARERKATEEWALLEQDKKDAIIEARELLEQAQKDEIAKRRALYGKDAEYATKFNYDTFIAERELFTFPEAEEIQIFISLVESRKPKRIFCTIEYIAEEVLERIIRRVLLNPKGVGEARVLQYQEIYVEAKTTSAAEKEAFKILMNERHVRRIETIEGRVEVFRRFLDMKADKEKLFAENPWLTQQLFGLCIKSSIVTPGAVSDEEVEKCRTLVTKRSNSKEVKDFFTELISQRRAKMPEQAMQLTMEDMLPKN